MELTSKSHDDLAQAKQHNKSADAQSEHMSSYQPAPVQSARKPGLDLLKALMALIVLARHTQFFSAASINPAKQPYTIASISWSLYHVLIDLAVPTFMAVSLYFFISKRLSNPDYLKGRSGRLLSLMLFWSALYLLHSLVTNYPVFSYEPLSLALFPFIDGSLYFLANLFQLTLLAGLLIWILERVPERFQVLLEISYLLIGVALVYLRGSFDADTASLFGKFIYMGIATYALYVPSLIIFIRRGPLVGLSLAFLASTAVAGAQSLSMLINFDPAQFTFGYGGYASVFALLLIFLFSKKVSENHPLISKIATYALGIYVVHPLVIALIEPLRSLGSLSVTFAGGHVTISVVFPLIVLSVTAFVLFIMEKIGLKSFIR